MNDWQLKQYLEKVTGVELTRKLAMPLFKGQVNLSNRPIVWHLYDATQQLPDHLPAAMRSEMQSFVSRFYSFYQQFVPNGNQQNFSTMMFMWYGEDASVTQAEMDALNKANLEPYVKQQLTRVAHFIQDKGVQLLMTPEEFEQNKNPQDKDGGYNGGSTHLERFGWAWGATPKGRTDDGSRRADHLPGKGFALGPQNDGTVVVQLATKEVNGTWGIFFWDGTEAIPVVPQKTLDQMKVYRAQTDQPLNPDDPVVKNILKGAGGIEKFFWYGSNQISDQESHQTKFAPCERRFLLETPDDPRPKGILWKTPGKMEQAGKKSVKNHPANDGRHRGMYTGGTRRKPYTDPRVHTLMMRVNGGLYWQNQANPNVQFPCTKEQVDYFNRFKGQYYRLANPGYQKYGFDNPTEAKQYQDDCYWLNKLREFVTSMGKTHVATQAYHVVMVGPRFTTGKQVGHQQTIGQMSTPETHSPNAPAVEHEGNFTGRRDDWVIVKHEYTLSDFRADMTGGGFSVPQSKSGMAGRGEEYGSTAQNAINEVMSEYNMPDRVRPDPKKVEAAQAAYDSAQQYYQQTQQPQQPEAPAPTVNQTPVQPEVTTQPSNTPQVEAPPTEVQQPGVTPPLPNDIFNKSSKDILAKLKKLG